MIKGNSFLKARFRVSIALATGIGLFSSSVQSQTVVDRLDTFPNPPVDFPIIPVNALSQDIIQDHLGNEDLPDVGLRRRAIDLNFAQLRSPQSRLSFTLFDGTTVWGTLGEVKSVLGTVTLLKGAIEGVNDGLFSLAFEGASAAGTIRLDDKIFSIRYVSEGLHILVENSPSEGVTCGVGSEGADLVFSEIERDTGSELSAFSTSGSPAVLDLLVVHTPAAFSPALRPNIVLGVDRLNGALQRSQINASVDIIHIQQVQYTESGSLVTDKNALRDGLIVDARRLRNGLGADFTLLVVNSATDYNGFADVLTPTNESGMNMNAAILASRVATIDLAHEVGHMLGSVHNREDPQSALDKYLTPDSPAPYGYRCVQCNFADIMSIPNGLPQIEYFSNPNVSVNGFPTGIAAPASNAADSARTLNFTAPRIAAWRSRTTLVSPLMNGAAFQATIAGLPLLATSNSQWTW